jgi:hypothetical protein
MVMLLQVEVVVTSAVLLGVSRSSGGRWSGPRDVGSGDVDRDRRLAVLSLSSYLLRILDRSLQSIEDERPAALAEQVLPGPVGA